MTRPQRRLRTVLLLATFGCLGCGAAETVDYVDSNVPVRRNATATSNVCPEFGWWLLLPKSLPNGETTEIIVNVADPDAPEAKLHFDWAAAFGTFSDPRSADTAYTCQQAGQQVLSLQARDDSDCTSTLHVDVLCMDSAP